MTNSFELNPAVSTVILKLFFFHYQESLFILSLPSVSISFGGSDLFRSATPDSALDSRIRSFQIGGYGFGSEYRYRVYQRICNVNFYLNVF
jgi:hypothetical protein